MKKLTISDSPAILVAGPAGNWARAAAHVRYLADSTSIARGLHGTGRTATTENEAIVDSSLCPSLLHRPAVPHGAVLRPQASPSNQADARVRGHPVAAATRRRAPSSVKLFLDTIDVVNEQAESFSASGSSPQGPLEAEEFEILRRFDEELAIQEREHSSVTRAGGPSERPFQVPRPPPLRRRELRESRAGRRFVASAWRGQSSRPSWLASEVWPRVERPISRFDVYGSVNKVYHGRVPASMTLHGTVPKLDAIYDLDRRGGEPGALRRRAQDQERGGARRRAPPGHDAGGRARLERGAARAFLLADSAEDFAAALRRVLDDAALRESLSREGHAFAQEALSPDVCFADLLREIESPRRYLAGEL